MTHSAFEEKRRDAAMAHLRTQDAIRNSISDMLLGGMSSPRRRRGRIGEIVTVTPVHEGAPDMDARHGGSFVVEILGSDTYPDRAWWEAVHDGVTDNQCWWTVDQALLHLIAIRHGDPDHRGDAVIYASRVLGFDDFPEMG